MYGVQLKDRGRAYDLMLMLGFDGTIDQLAMASSVRWYGHVLRRENGDEKGIRFRGWMSKEDKKVENDTEHACWRCKH